MATSDHGQKIKLPLIFINYPWTGPIDKSGSILPGYRFMGFVYKI